MSYKEYNECCQLMEITLDRVLDLHTRLQAKAFPTYEAFLRDFLSIYDF